jgi:hypothetical protein
MVNNYKIAKELFQDICKGTAKVIAAPFLGKTIYRICDDEMDSDLLCFYSIAAPIITCLASGIGLIAPKIDPQTEVSSTTLLALSVPWITNSASLIYEKFREKKEKYEFEEKRKLLLNPTIPSEEKPASPLETKVSSLQTSPRKVIDPWSIDIPEIKNQFYSSGGEK